MSNNIYPTLPGLKFPIGRTPMWATNSVAVASGREARTTYWTYPKYQFDLSYEFLRAATAYGEFQALNGFFNNRFGGLDDFLYVDPDFNTVTDMVIASGNGTTTQYTLTQNLTGAAEPIGYATTITNVKVNGTATGAYTTGDQRNIIFSSAPGAGQSITWSGTFAYRVKFKDDTINSMAKFMDQYFSTGTISLISVKP